jgi:adenylate cyclase class IV
MPKELKLKLSDPQELERTLKKLQAKLLDETIFKDTYFKQPKGKVLKLVEKKQGVYINVFEENNGTFEVLKDEPIRDAASQEIAYKKSYGIKKVLKGRRKFYALDDYKIILNMIEGVGDFLIVTNENPQKSFVVNTLGIKDPIYITVSFDEL